MRYFSFYVWDQPTTLPFFIRRSNGLYIYTHIYSCFYANWKFDVEGRYCYFREMMSLFSIAPEKTWRTTVAVTTHIHDAPNKNCVVEIDDYSRVMINGTQILLRTYVDYDQTPFTHFGCRRISTYSHKRARNHRIRRLSSMVGVIKSKTYFSYVENQ